MPTDKPRVTITMSQEQYQAIEAYRFNTRQKNQTQAILSLISSGIESISKPDSCSLKTKNSPSYTDEEKDLVSDYRSLDKPGKRAVQVTVADQKQRVSDEQKKARSKTTEGHAAGEETRVIPLYYNPAAAGLASPAFGEDFEYLEVGGEVPAFADFAVKIEGNSMEPYIVDGSIVYVNHDPMVNGDIGIFYCDGDILCKQYAKDEEGNINLISLNRDREDADRFIDAYSNLSFTCLGRVIMQHTVRLPEEFRE